MRRTDIPRTAPRASGLAGGGRDHTEWSHWAPFVEENKCSTKPDVRQDFSKPPAGVTDAAPTGRRHGAGKPQASAEAIADRHSRSGKQGVWFRGAGNFFARTG